MNKWQRFNLRRSCITCVASERIHPKWSKIILKLNYRLTRHHCSTQMVSETSSATQHNISISLFVSAFPMKSFLIICNPSLVPGCRPFHPTTPPPTHTHTHTSSTRVRTNGHLAGGKCCRRDSAEHFQAVNWATILAVKNGKANQFSRVLVGLCSQRSVAAAVNIIHSAECYLCCVCVCVCCWCRCWLSIWDSSRLFVLGVFPQPCCFVRRSLAEGNGWRVTPERDVASGLTVFALAISLVRQCARGF